jgi:hypothetical protein
MQLWHLTFQTQRFMTLHVLQGIHQKCKYGAARTIQLISNDFKSRYQTVAKWKNLKLSGDLTAWESQQHPRKLSVWTTAHL